MSISTGISQKQTAGMGPEHLLGKAVLKMSLQELQELIQTELNENPALAIAEESVCPVCGSILTAGSCLTCGSSVVEEEQPVGVSDDDWPEDGFCTSVEFPDEDYEPFAAVASPMSLEDYLIEQIHSQFEDEDIPVAEFIVSSLDEDGYLREPLFDLAAQFNMSVPQFEHVLEQVQKLDPPGIAARSLQECLLIQIRQLDSPEEEKAKVEAVILECWDLVSRMKLDDAAQRIGVTRADILSALAYIRERLNPHPAAMFRDPWQMMAPRKEAKLAPDVVIRESENGQIIEVIDPLTGRISIDEIYASLYAEMSRKKNGFAEKDRELVREQVQNARALIDALEFRKSTLRILSEELFRCQSEFFMKGPAYLKPMTRKQLAQQVGLHESTICRALDGKTIRLQTGEIIPFDMLFDSALPVKELVRKLTYERINGKPLSDSQIAERLQSQGIQIARRTVAKYRDELRVLPVEYRI